MLMFIAQPADEIVLGAKAMLADGLFTRFPKPNFGFALHDGPLSFRDFFPGRCTSTGSQQFIKY
ncbi:MULTISPECIES: hypothetical protein [Bradyrhizobium]|uniref:Uncharacterized protein n=1 Tax=Bradyrhizobium vignae TaxID=1549949 RepID=A0ABS4A6I3_9BRAD|nr:hypothetical protein [Bradyrhizobium vignae]MBP0116022.1 hypothetical protein [Bradyrhizobium vignae]RXG84555.1 hypothetical protein EAV90_36800 [Bradyrhizobium vignae]